jgi:hypothetical protein
MKHRRTAKEKELEDNSRLLRVWKAWHREEREAVLAGPHSATLGELFRMFANLAHVRPAELIGFVGAIDWSAIDYDTRLTVLHEINSAITKLREKRGLEPISDPLPHQPDNVFRVLKSILTVPRPQGGRSEPRHIGKCETMETSNE